MLSITQDFLLSMFNSMAKRLGLILAQYIAWNRGSLIRFYECLGPEFLHEFNYTMSFTAITINAIFTFIISVFFYFTITQDLIP